MGTVNTDHARVHVSDDSKSLVVDLAEKFIELGKTAIAERGRFTVALSGGSTPKALYELLATDAYSKRVEWNKVYLFLGDERCVAHDHPDSNYLMVQKALLSKVSDVHCYPTEGQDQDPSAAALNYEKQLAETFGKEIAFDLILLGLGPDGHTASLFPESEGLKEKSSSFIANFVAKFDSWRLTLTYPVLNNGRNVIFMVSGDGKADIVAQVIEGKEKKYPSQSVQPLSGNLTFYLDKAAAGKLTGGLKNG